MRKDNKRRGETDEDLACRVWARLALKRPVFAALGLQRKQPHCAFDVRVALTPALSQRERGQDGERGRGRP